MQITKWHDKYCRDVKLKYNSFCTQKTYSSVVSLFLFHFKNEIDPQHISTNKIKEWILLAETINTRRNRLCAIKSFYELTVGMPTKIDKIPYPQKEKKLPIPLSQEEVQRMFNVCENVKHKTILALLYSCGLRVSELINLTWENIDRERMVIHVIAGKGKKDRQVPLAPNLIPLLTKYWNEIRKHEKDNKEFVFGGQFSNQYSARSVGEVVKQLAEKAAIKNKRVYTHLMRHCSFTHLLEQGTDLTLIQKIAGHSSPKTTQIYTHISSNLIALINTPLSSITL